MELSYKNEQYKFQPANSDRYPPHLDVIPSKDNATQYEIFNKLGLVEAAVLLQKIVPAKTFIGRWTNSLTTIARKIVAGEPYAGSLLRDVERNNEQDKNRKTGTDIMRGENIGDIKDWFSDARFAQQQFTGTNPTTITKASEQWVDNFVSAARAQKLLNVVERILTADKGGNLFIQDFSYFRHALGDSVKPNDTLMVVGEAEATEDKNKDQKKDKNKDKNEANRYMCAAVSLFELNLDGRLHPLAIVTDWKGSIDNSVTIFNKRLQPTARANDPMAHVEEETDWPWRYAKTCAQVSDWVR